MFNLRRILDIGVFGHTPHNLAKRTRLLNGFCLFTIVVCVAAAQRRGIVDEGEMQRNGKDAENIAEGFRISGLGQLIEAGVQSDRLVVFGD